MIVLATIDALATRLGRQLEEDERPRAEAILVDVTAIALGETGAKWTLEDVPADVAAVILAAALRLFKNPDRYIDQKIGSFSATVHHSEFSAGVFTKAEQAVLQRNSQRAGFGGLGIATIQRTRDSELTRVHYVETNWPGSPIPYYEE